MDFYKTLRETVLVSVTSNMFVKHVHSTGQLLFLWACPRAVYWPPVIFLKSCCELNERIAVLLKICILAYWIWKCYHSRPSSALYFAAQLIEMKEKKWQLEENRPERLHSVSHYSDSLSSPDINECTSLPEPCKPGFNCINTVGSYTCQRNTLTCSRGYHSNEEGTRCIGKVGLQRLVRCPLRGKSAFHFWKEVLSYL